MKKVLLIRLTFVVIVGVVTSCVVPNSFQNDATIYGAASGGPHRQIFQTSCYACHSAGQTPPDMTLDDDALVLSGLVFPGSPDNSPLILKVQGLSGSIMPKAPYAPLSNDEIQVLKDWITNL